MAVGCTATSEFPEPVSVTSHGNADFAEVKLGILSWGIYHDPSGPSIITRVLIRGRREAETEDGGDRMTHAKAA